MLNDIHVVLADDRFPVVVTTSKVAIVVLAAGLFAALYGTMARSRFSRAWRACTDDSSMAALCGVPLGRTLGWTFVISAAYAGVAGVVIALHYGTLSFHMGTMLGFKALTAALLGGIGSLPGAMLGGLLVAAVETVWSAYLAGDYRDVAVFGLLALTLVFRPNGLLGSPSLEGRTGAARR